MEPQVRYRMWEEGKGSDFVPEVASRSAWREDVERKPGVYAGLATGRRLPRNQGMWCA